MGSIPGLGRSPGEVNDNPLHYSCLENSMDSGAWGTMVHRVGRSQTQLNMHTLYLRLVLSLKLSPQSFFRRHE